jgi:hypothetical protein
MHTTAPLALQEHPKAGQNEFDLSYFAFQQLAHLMYGIMMVVSRFFWEGCGSRGRMGEGTLYDAVCPWWERSAIGARIVGREGWAALLGRARDQYQLKS